MVFDVNFRPTLLSADKAGENLRKLAPFITHLIGNEEHLKMQSLNEKVLTLSG